MPALEQLERKVFAKLARAVLIGISQGLRGRGAPKIFQFPFTASHSFGGLSEGMGPTRLAKKHRHQVALRGDSSGMTFGLRLFNGLLELDSRKDCRELPEYVGRVARRKPTLARGVGYLAKVNLP